MLLLGQFTPFNGSLKGTGESQMRMGLDQSWHQCSALAIDEPCTVGSAERAASRYIDNAVTPDLHLTGIGIRSVAVENEDIAKDRAIHASVLCWCNVLV